MTFCKYDQNLKSGQNFGQSQMATGFEKMDGFRLEPKSSTAPVETKHYTNISMDTDTTML